MHRLYTLQWPGWYLFMKVRRLDAGLRYAASMPDAGKPVAMMRSLASA